MYVYVYTYIHIYIYIYMLIYSCDTGVTLASTAYQPLLWTLKSLAQDLPSSNPQTVAQRPCHCQNGALQQMALRTPIMARTPDNCGKELLLQSTARAPPLQLMHCQHCSRRQLLQGAAQHKLISCRCMMWDYLAQSVAEMLQSNLRWKTLWSRRHALASALRPAPLSKASV